MKATVAGLIAIVAVAALTQPAATQPVRKVALLCAVSCSNLPSMVESWDRAFMSRLEQAGFRAGRNLDVDLSGVGVGVLGLPSAARRLVERRVDVIVTVGTSAAHAAREATTTVPIVMINAADPVEAGLIHSLARPGGNITGLAVPVEQLLMKQIELLTRMAPGIVRIAVMSTALTELQRQRIAHVETSVRPLGVQVHAIEVTGFTDIDNAFAILRRERTEGILVTEQLAATLMRGTIVTWALQHRLPIVGTDNYFVEGGGLIAYGPSFEDQYARAAVLVARVLEGAKPGALPVQEPLRYELVVNLTTARAIGITIPPSVLLQADRVVE